MRRKTRFLSSTSCARCGGIERYVSDHGCVRCKLEQSKARRIAATRSRKAAGRSRTFRGAECPRGHRLRFRSNGSCVECSRAAYRAANAHRTPQAEVSKRARTPNRKRALARGDRFYEGSACSKCGHAQRFTQDGSCRFCKSTHYQRLTCAAKDRQLERQRNYDRRAYRALRVLQELGIPL